MKEHNISSTNNTSVIVLPKINGTKLFKLQLGEILQNNILQNVKVMDNKERLRQCIILGDMLWDSGLDSELLGIRGAIVKI